MQIHSETVYFISMPYIAVQLRILRNAGLLAIVYNGRTDKNQAKGPL